ncbi:MAG: T9SS type A sorting domain-containing protein [Saprospiraceae bacterium]|nr:T9SS type A sorting domain-containing protein [Saprospiraceae bacterium]MDW8230673.1 T9SS type A sorting domain-containing protein [Saprospiraceae bacterium]
MRKITCCLPLWAALLAALPALSQPHYPDEWWPIGVNEYPGVSGYGNAWIRFRNGVPSVQLAQLNMNFEAAVAVGADTLGNVLFYSNGCEIRGADGQLLENGAGLNPGPLHDWTCGKVGYTAPRSMTALPMPGHPSRWALLHLGGDYHPSRKMVYGPLYLTEIDMAAHGGRGAVTSKNAVVAQGDLEPFAIVRHGNGRDWWVVLPEYGTNRYRIWLLSPQGLALHAVQSIGPPIGCRRTGSSVFSPDGAKYARTNSCLAVVLDFDRCAGVFSRPIPLPRDKGLLGGGGLAFSPDNRWLYATTDLCVFRADLTESQPYLDSLYRWPYLYVGEPQVSQYVYGTSLTYMQLAPDGRLYMAARHRERYYPRFIIQGDNYAFEPKGFKLPVPTVRTLPHFPNFRLRTLTGSPCDTLGIVSAPEASPPDHLAVRFNPNPFRERLVANATESGTLWLFSIEGRLILSLPLQIGENPIETAGLEAGVYFWQVLTTAGNMQTGRLVKAPSR